MGSALRLLPVALAGLTFAAFLPALDGEFLNWDDPANFLGNPGYRGLDIAHLRWMFTTTLLGHYVPLTWVSLGLNYVLGGMQPWGYHLGNLLLHAANVALVYLVARRLLTAALVDPPLSPLALSAGAAGAALTFGLHPLRVESVAWVTERRDVLCGLFYLLAVLAYARGAAGRGPVHGRWRALSVGAFAAALLSKAIAMTLPLTLLLLDAYPLRRWSLGWRTLLREKVAHAALAGGAAVVAAVAVTRGAAWTGYDVYGPGSRIAMFGYSLWFYPAALLWPEGLSPLYELPARVDPWSARFALPIVAVIGVTTGLLLLRRRFPGGLVAWLHSAIVIAPVGGIVHAGYQLAHDRYSYLSGLGFAVLAGAGLAWVVRAVEQGRLRRSLGLAVVATAALALLGWGASTWRQAQIWRSSEALWRAAVRADPSCSICHGSLGIALMRSAGPLTARRVAEAEAHFRVAIELRPDLPDPYYNLGAVLASQGRYREAEPVLDRFMRLSPGRAEGPARLGMLYVDQGRLAEAVPLLREALRLNPQLAIARADLGRVLASVAAARAEKGQLAEAVTLLRESVELRDDQPEPQRTLGRALVEMGRAGEAVAPLRRAVALDPRDPAARFWLARAYLLAGDRGRAEAEVATLRELDAALADRVIHDHRGERHERR